MKWIQKFEQAHDAANWIIATCTESKIWCFTGHLGAGKTTTIKAICKSLGYQGEVTSPTYAIINEYMSDECMIFHMDLYRLRNIEEADEIGFEEYIDDKEAYKLIEWPKLIEQYIPHDRYDIQIVKIDVENEWREITITFQQNTD